MIFNFDIITWCVSVIPSSQGPPACLMELIGLAPVPPSCPDICQGKLEIFVLGQIGNGRILEGHGSNFSCCSKVS